MELLYIDPGTGSYLVQMIIAAVLGGMFVLKTYWFKIKSFFTGEDYSDKMNTSDDSDDPEEIEY